MCSMVHIYVHGFLLETMALPWTCNRLCELETVEASQWVRCINKAMAIEPFTCLHV